MFISYLSSLPSPEHHHFSVEVTGSSQYIQLGQEKLLMVSRHSKFALAFRFTQPPPRGCRLAALVTCQKAVDAQRLGAVHRCSRHVAQEGVGGEWGQGKDGGCGVGGACFAWH